MKVERFAVEEEFTTHLFRKKTKFPYLLPRSHAFTKLIVLEIHGNLKHAGVLSTVTQIRQTYWIPRIRQFVRKILGACVTCRRISSKPYATLDPPKVRLHEAPPFTITGVDFTGALYVRDKNIPKKKAYICLFTCASTRAVHLEVVSDLSEESFLQAFRRFSSRKSRPRTLVSDNALMYTAASETLRKLTQSETLSSALGTYGTNWVFIPKGAPWYGGWWERLIGLTKTCIRKTLGTSCITLETLQTIVTEIEAIINDRPLTYVASDFDDQEPLTPSHLLYGRLINVTPYPQEEISNTSFNDAGKGELCKRFERQSVIISHFWNRWKNDYLTSLREYHNQTGNNGRTIQVGDIVQVHDNKLPRNRWNLAVVEDLMTGKDGLTRSAVIRTKSGRTTHPVVKLYPLEIRTNIHGDDNTRDDETKTNRDAFLRAREKIQAMTKGKM